MTDHKTRTATEIARTVIDNAGDLANLAQDTRDVAVLAREFIKLEVDLEHLVTNAGPDSCADLVSRARAAERDAVAARAVAEKLWAELNTPQTVNFLEAVRVESAHQRERWGVEHDAGKRPEDWIALLVYLLGKATKAHYDGDRDKLLHHVITVAAVCSNWHANATGVDTRMRPGLPAQEQP